MPATSYRNSVWKPEGKGYGPEFYTTDVTPKGYRGYLIYHRLMDVYDIVKDGVCVTQYAGPRGAREAIDRLLARA